MSTLFSHLLPGSFLMGHRPGENPGACPSRDMGHFGAETWGPPGLRCCRRPRGGPLRVFCSLGPKLVPEEGLKLGADQRPGPCWAGGASELGRT